MGKLNDSQLQCEQPKLKPVGAKDTTAELAVQQRLGSFFWVKLYFSHADMTNQTTATSGSKCALSS